MATTTVDYTKLKHKCKVCYKTPVISANMTCNKCSRMSRRWGTDYKRVTLKHLLWTAKRLKYFYPSKELIEGLDYFIKRQPKLQPMYSTPHLARVLCTTSIFASKGWIEYGPSFMTYLIYLMTDDTNMYYLRDAKKQRYKIADALKEFTYQVNNKPYRLFGTLLLEAQRLEKFIEDKDIEITMVYKPKDYSKQV